MPSISDLDKLREGLPGPLPNSIVDNIVATPGGGQAAAVPLTGGMNRVTTVGTANDSVLLPPAKPGSRVIVVNATATTMHVFPRVGDRVRDYAVNLPNLQLTLMLVEYICMRAGVWDTMPSPGA